MHDYYCLLAMDITTIGFLSDTDYFIQMTGHRPGAFGMLRM